MRYTSRVCAFAICLLVCQSSFGEIVSVKLTTNALGLGGVPLNAGPTVGPDLPGFVTSPTVGEGSVLSIQKSGVAGVGSVADPLFVTITGRTYLDTTTGVPSPSDYLAGAIYIDSEDTALPDGSKEGIGVRAFNVNASGMRTFSGGLARIEGSKHVSGGTGPTTFDPGSPNGSPHVDEDVLFTFDTGVATNAQSVEVLLSDYNAGEIIDLHIELQTGGPIDLSFLQTSDTGLFQQLGTNLWKVRFSAPSLGLTATDVVTSFRIRANDDLPSSPSGTAEHFFITGMTVDAIITECDANTPGACDDGMPCSIDTCVGGQCVHEPVQCPIGLQCDPISGACVECSPALKCPPVDLVFVMDTSGSMQDEGDALCNAINNVVMLLLADGINVTPTILAIAPINNNNLFSCQTPADTVSALLGNPVPGNNGTCSGDLTGPGDSNRDENWGSASSIVADRYPWTPGAQRIIVPISDEGPCMGSSSNGCNDPGSDRDAITNAIAIALANEVAISPITAMGSSTCVITLAQAAAAGTGGIWHPSTDPKVDLATSIANIVQVACSKSNQCDDGDICTVADTCVNGQCNGSPADCDDLNECTIDDCDPITGGCTHTPSDALCDNGNACDGMETCDATVGCQSGTPLSCDNLQFCDGLETCNPASGCQSGTPPSCDDGVSCTVGSCDEILDVCVQTPSDTLCDNGQFCDGSETCDATLGCQAGTPVNCNDGVACTNDACDEIGNACVHTPTDALCDNGQFCDGSETCDATLGCQAGTAPNCSDGVACTDDSCDEVGDVCVNSPNNGNCDDLIACTIDVCDPVLGCTHTPDNSVCNNGNVCDGIETCDATLGCQAGTPLGCDNGQFCDGLETCDPVGGCQTGTPPNCTDAIACTVGSCDETLDTCVQTPLDSLCDNGQFCDGSETCDTILGCQAGSPTDCSDGVACTDDACDEINDLCVHTANDTLCDNGQFCDGSETCDTLLGCQAGTAPNCSDGVACTDDSCDEVADVCVSSPNNGNCDDLIGCTIDTCDPILGCGHTPDDSLCGNGLFCDGAETCDSLLDCQAGTPPNCDDGVACTGDACDEANDTCTHAPNDAACTDGVACTVDVCNPITGCGSTPDNGLCDNGVFCDGPETCDPLTGCQPSTNPCVLPLKCEEAGDQCVDCLTDAQCDDGLFCNGAEMCIGFVCQAGAPPNCSDGVGCTDDSCNETTDTCDHATNDGLCNNSLFCDGIETCDLLTDCQTGTAPNCNDGVGCTVDACNEATDTCDHTADNGLCDNGQFCDGSETCDAINDCQLGTPPDCNDGVGCTVDSCNETTDVCDHTPNNGLCDNGQFCDGSETCDAINDCQAGTPVSCDDSVACTVDSCDEVLDLCVFTPTDTLCDNGQFCDGSEVCDATAGCQTGTPPNCSDGVGCTDDSCNETTDTCVHSPNNGLCDNSLYCDGMETCDPVTDCQPGTPPNCNDTVGCTVDSCDEVIDQCVNAPDNSLCDNGAYCDGMETCDAINDCQAGTPPNCDDGVSCTVDACNEATDVCDHAATDGLCDNGQFCDGSETCDAVNDCQTGTPPVCDDGVACTVDSCDAAMNQCLFAPMDTLCDNGQFCDGAEVCDAANGCLAGAPPNCNDGVGCTDDSCDEVANVCVNTANDGLCDNGLFCDGSETCNAAIGCQAGAAPNCDDGIACTADSCDEASSTCVNAGDNAACDDGNPCTLDICADNGCTHPDFCGACCVGAICTPNVLLNQCTDVLGGEFAGPGSVCTGTTCGGMPVPTVSEWGLAVLALMLLTLHKLYFRRRAATA